MLNGVLGALDGFGHHLGLDCFVIGQCATHHPRQGTRGKQPHEFVIEAQIKTARPRVTLAASATAQLIVDATTFVALGAQHIQATKLTHFVAFCFAHLGVFTHQFRQALVGLAPRGDVVHRHFFECNRQRKLIQQRVGMMAVFQHLGTRHPLGVATQQNIHTATSHVGGNGDSTHSTRLRNDRRLARVLFGIQHFVFNSTLLQLAGQHFTLFHTHRAHQNRLALFMAGHDVINHRRKFGLFGLEDQVGFVGAHHLAISGDRHDIQAIGVHQFGCFGLRRAGHAGKF